MVTDPTISSEHQGVLNPRNSKQIENAKSKNQMIARISHDSLYALHEVAYHLDNFVWQIETYPDLCCVVGNVNALQELEELMKSEDKHN